MLTLTPRGSASASDASSRRNGEDVGIPPENKWDLVAAHERRFCFDHKEDEWLLEYAQRWMYPSDFSVSGAAVTLKDKLQKYLSAGSNSRPHKQASRAEWLLLSTMCSFTVNLHIGSHGLRIVAVSNANK
jgi:hypothetical protein